MRKTAIHQGALLVTGIFVAACAGGGEGPPVSTGATPPGEVTITATDSTLEAPDTLPAGFIAARLVNHGTQPHAATLVRLDDGRNLPEYIAAYREANRTKTPRPSWATFHGGPAAMLSHGEGHAILHLEPGDYAWVCFVPGPDGVSHLIAHQQAHAFVVRASDGTAAVPPPGATMSLRMVDFGYELGAALKAGRQLIRVENAGVEPHHTLVFKLLPGKTIDDFHAWIGNNMQGEEPAAFVSAMAEQSAGTEAWLDLDLTAGDYVLVCLVAGQDEVPHVANGMIQSVHVE